MQTTNYKFQVIESSSVDKLSSIEFSPGQFIIVDNGAGIYYDPTTGTSISDRENITSGTSSDNAASNSIIDMGDVAGFYEFDSNLTPGLYSFRLDGNDGYLIVGETMKDSDPAEMRYIYQIFINLKTSAVPIPSPLSQRWYDIDDAGVWTDLSALIDVGPPMQCAYVTKGFEESLTQEDYNGLNIYMTTEGSIITEFYPSVMYGWRQVKFDANGAVYHRVYDTFETEDGDIDEGWSDWEAASLDYNNLSNKPPMSFEENGGVTIGEDASVSGGRDGIAIGCHADTAGSKGTAVGHHAMAVDGVSIGANAFSIGGIQLGEGRNEDEEKTLQVYEYKLLNADGTIPPERFISDGVIIKSSTSGSTKQFKLTIDDTGTISTTLVSDSSSSSSSSDGITIRSSTAGSSKQFKLTIDDTGTISTVEL